MTTVADLVEHTVEHLYGTARATLNFLTSGVDADDTTFTFEDDITATIGPGSFLSVDNELVYVRSVVVASKTAVVLRAQRGTTAASHAAETLVDVNPRFPRYRVKRALLEDIRAWPDTLYRTTTIDLATTVGGAGYDLTGLDPSFLGIVDIQGGPHAHDSSLRWTRPMYNLLRGADTDVFPSGSAVVFERGYHDVRDLRAVVAIPFDLTTWDDATDLLDDCGIPESMHDIPPLGAAARLMVGQDVKRSSTAAQGEPRHADEVPAGFSSSVATYLRRTRDQRISEEAAKLRAAHPLRSL